MEAAAAKNSALLVPATDRSFLYGDGVFETLLIANGIPLWPHLHLERLRLGVDRLRIPVDMAEVRDAITGVQHHYQITAGILRVTVSRGDGKRGYAPSKGVAARVTAAHSPLGREPFEALPAAEVATSSIIMGDQPLLAGLKHCNRLEQVMAAAEADERGVDDVVLTRGDGSYQCSSNANVFFLQGDHLLTSPCDQSGVSGTRRRLVVESLSVKLGLRVTETPVTEAELSNSDAVFLCNSVIGIRGVSRWGNRLFEPSAIVSQLQTAYFDEARQCCAL
ncbi:aminodeoxychorismate lyase [Congregibacter sp.]|uniref:aminodeoxychorismate lyase n=1 Tax=Congregibacter sp. TaxID=2744308 RepID=UPI003F6BD744